MTVMVPYLCAAFITAGPVAAGVILIVRKVCRAIVLATGQNIMLVRFIATAFDAITRFIESGFQRDGTIVQVQVGQVGRNQYAMCIVPGTLRICSCPA